MRVLGIGLAIGCLLLFPLFLRLVQRSPLDLRIDSPVTSRGPTFDIRAERLGEVLIDNKVDAVGDSLIPGLHYAQWQNSYRGGKTRSIGHSQLIGPFQDPSAPPCSTFLLISQSFLDNSTADQPASPNTLAQIVGAQIHSELAGLSVWPLGSFEKMDGLSLQWTRWGQDGESKPWQERLRIPGQKTSLQGHLEVDFTATFAKGKVPLNLKMTPIIEKGSLRFQVNVRAKLDLDNRLYQWIANTFDGNDRASSLVKREIRAGLRSLLDKPPPIPLGNGSFLPLEFCKNRQIIFSKQGHVSVPLAIGIANRSPRPPLRISPSQPSSMPMESGLAVEIDENGLNAILHSLWSSKLLDDHLASSLVHSFNEQETVRNFLSIRLRKANFHLPPTISLTPEFRIRAAASTIIEDGESLTDARLYTQIGFGLDLLHAATKDEASPQLTLRSIELTCLKEPGILQSCYAGLMSQVRANQETLQNLLTNSFTKLLSSLLTKRVISDSRTTGRYLLERVRFQSAGKRIRAHLQGQLDSL